MRFIPKKYASFVVLALLIALMALIAWFGIMPLRQAITEKMDDIQKLHTSRENRERQIRRLPELEEQFREITESEDVMRILLSEDKIVDFVKTLEALANGSGVAVVISSKESNAIVEKKAVKPAAKPTAGEDHAAAQPAAQPTNNKGAAGITDGLPFERYLHINIQVRGEYPDIISFFHKLETLPFALDVIGVDIRAEGERGSSAPASGTNPFRILGGDASDVVAQPTAEEAPPQGKPLEANLDTVVYIDK